MAYYTNSVDYCTGEITGTSATTTLDYRGHIYGTSDNITWGNWGNYEYYNSGTSDYKATIINNNPITYKLWDGWEVPSGVYGTGYGTGQITGNINGITINGIVTNELIVNGTLDYNQDFNKYVVWPSEPATKKGIFKDKLRSNLAIVVKSRVETPQAVSPAEQIAMETLREFISETEFRKYLRYGFVLVKGKSGDTFQIFRNRSHTKVWRNGQVVEEVCVRIQQGENVPPTDNVIAFRSIIQSDEEAFRKLGNVYKMKKAA